MLAFLVASIETTGIDLTRYPTQELVIEKAKPNAEIHLN